MEQKDNRLKLELREKFALVSLSLGLTALAGMWFVGEVEKTVNDSVEYISQLQMEDIQNIIDQQQPID